MKKYTLLLLGIFSLCYSNTFGSNRYWVASTSANWNTPSNWSTSNGGTGGASVPITGDFAYFNANGLGNCTLDIPANFDGINTSGYTGVIDLAGFSFNPAVSGSQSCTFSSGTISDTPGTSSVTFNTNGVATFSGTTFNTPIIAIAGRVAFNGGIFNQTVEVEDTGGSSTNGAGGCTFNATFKVTNSGTSYFLMGYTNPDIFNDDVTLINTSSSRIRIAYNSIGNQFNGHIYVSSNNGSGVQFGESSGQATLAASKTISVLGSGFSKGDLLLKNFTQTGSTSQSIVLSNTAYFKIYSGDFGGDVNFTAPRMVINGSTFSGTSAFTKTGSGSDYSSGSNTFTGNCIITHSGSSSFLFGNTNPDSFLGNLNLRNTGTGSIYLAHNSLVNNITGNLTVTNSATGSNNYVHLAQGTASSLTVNGTTTLNNNASASNGQIIIAENGDVVFNNNVNLQNNATGNSGSISLASNSNASVIINGSTTVINNGSGSYKRVNLGSSGDMTFNGDLSLTNNASANNSEIFLNYNSSSTNIYNGNISVANTHASGDGIRFGQNQGIGTLASTKTISLGGNYISGELRLRNFTSSNTSPINLNLTGTASLVLYNSSFAGNVNFISPRIYTAFSTFAGSSLLAKSGASNDASIGGNTFTGNTELRNSGTGYFLMGNGNPDVFNANLTMNNNGTKHMYLAHNSPGNLVNGNLIMNNNGSGSDTYMYASTYTASTLTINGSSTFNNNSTSSNGRLILGESGDIDFNGDLSITNNANGSSGYVYLGTNSTSNINVTGTANFINNGSGSTKRMYLGNSGDLTFHANLNVTNNSSATNSEIYIAHGASSTCIFNGHITISNSSPDGIRFGESNGVSTLAASKTISIGTGFSDGSLRLDNFTQLGNTPQSLIATGNTYLIIDNSSFGGNIIFKSPRFYTRGTTYSGTTLLEKTGGIGDDACAGGNTFVGNSSIINSGSKYLRFGSGNADIFQANLTLTNSGTNSLYFAYSTAGHAVANDLTIINSATGNGNRTVNIGDQTSSTMTVGGNVSVSNNSSGQELNIYFPNRGNSTVSGTFDIMNSGSGTKSQVVLANYSSSSLVITGATGVTNDDNASSRNRIYLGNYGDITFNSTLDINNNASSSESEVFCNYRTNSVNAYQDNITVTSNSATCDGIYFGREGGIGTLAATKTITIPGTDNLNYLGGELYFRNFTQTGATPHSFELAVTATRIYNYNSNWGGDVSFIAPRIYLRGTTISGTSYIEKTGSGDDDCYGGNNYVGNTEIILNNSSGNGRLNLANVDSSNFGGNLILTNKGSKGDMTFGSASGVYSIGGNVTLTNSSTGTGNQSIVFLNKSTASLNIPGTVTITNNSNGTGGSHNIHLGYNGQLNVAGNTTVTNSGLLGSTKNVYLGYNADVLFGGDVNITNTSSASTAQIIIASGTSSQVIINGNTTLTSTGTGSNNDCYLGNYGDVTFNGFLDMTNGSTAPSSKIYLNYRSSSTNTFNGNITLKSTQIASDGFLFGNQGGNSTLAATKTISIPGTDITNFVGGQLYFRNFTQTGPSVHSFELATTASYIYNYNSNWGGDVSFSAPRIYTRGTTFNGTAYFEKSGAGDDYSYGGNTYSGNVSFILNNNIANGRFYVSYYSPSSIGADLTLKNKGEFSDFAYGSAAGTYNIGGNLTVSNESTGAGNQNVYFINHASAISTVGGTATFTNSPTAATGTHNLYISNLGSLTIANNVTVSNTGTGGSTKNVYVGNSGDIAFGGNLDLINASSAATAIFHVANGSSSTVTIAGNTSLANSGAGSNKQCYIGNYGDVTFNGDLDMSNASSAPSSQVYLNYRTGSSNTFNGNITLKSTHTSGDGYSFGSQGGTATLAATKSVSIPGVDQTNFIGGDLRFYNFTQTGNTAHSFELANTANYIYSRNSTWGGSVNFVAPRTYVHTSMFNNDAYFEKKGQTNDDWYGGNTFNGNTEIVHNNNVASGRLYLASSAADTYNGNLTLRNKGAFSELLCGNNAGTYTINGDLSIYHETTGANSQYFYLGNNASTIFNISGNLVVNNTSSGVSGNHHVYISNNGLVNVGGNVTVLNSHTNGVTKNIYLGNSGDLNITGDLDVSNSSSATTAQILIGYNTSSSVTIGGNSTLSNSGAGSNKQWFIGYNGDATMNGNLDITNNSTATSNQVYLNYGSNSSNAYNGNITLKSTHLNSDGYLFGSGNGTGVLAASKTISIPGGAANFVGGELYFRNFTQTGNTPQSLEIAQSAYRFYTRESTWGGNLNLKAPSIQTRFTTYSGTTIFEKTGAVNDASEGGNTFLGTSILKNSGSGYFLMGNGNPDDFQSDLTMTNTGTYNMYLAHNSAGNNVSGDLVVNHNTTGSNNTFYISTSSNSTLTIGGNATLNNNSSATTAYLYIGDQGDISFNSGLTINNNSTSNNGHILFANNSRSTITVGGNTNVSNFNSGTYKRIYMGYNGDITYNGEVTFNNQSSASYSEIYSNYDNSSQVQFNDNIIVTSTNTSSDGIRFGESEGTASLAASKTVSVGGSGFIAGYLMFRNFTQQGTSLQNLTLTGTSILNLFTSSWYGDVNFVSPRINFKNSLFNRTSVLNKTGGSDDRSDGGNTFNGDAHIINTGTGYLSPCYRITNDYNGNATFSKTGSGNIYPALDIACTFAGDLTINANSVVRIGNSGSGRAIFDGSGTQTINQLGTAPSIEIRDLQTSKTNGEVILNTPVTILKELDLDNGNVVTTTTNSLTMNDNTSVSSVSDDAYVDGPVLKYGNDAFTFPTGNGGYYAPITMSSPSTSLFEASYHYSSAHAAGFDTTMVSAGLDHISNNEYWVLNRLTGTSNVKATIAFKNTRSDIDGAGALCNVRVARWNGTTWANEGNGGSTGNMINGTIITGTSEDCATSTKLTDWTLDLPITLAVDSNYITWDGNTYDGGSGTASAPGPSDGTRVLKVYAPNAVLPGDATVAHVIVTPTGNLTIESGKVLEVNGTILNSGVMTIKSGASLIQTSTGTNGNEGAGTYHVEREGNASDASYNIWSSPIQTAQLSNIFSSSNPCDVWAFDEVNQAWKHDYAVGYSSTCYGNAVTFGASSVITGGDGQMDVARGYFVPGTAVTTRAYSGKVNNGDISIPIAVTNLGHNPLWDNDDWNLVGNPYPSALNATAFLLENATNNNRIDGSIYFWDAGDTAVGYNQHSDYATFNTLGGVRSGNSTKTPTGEIASGQGFWVYAHANTNLEFNNSMRSSDNDQFFKTDPSETHLAWIEVVNPNNYKNNILVGYNSTTTDSVDLAYDAHKLEGSSNIRFASLIAQDEFAIQGFKSLGVNETKSIPLVIWSSDSGTHVFSNYKLQNIPSNIKIYMKDNMLNITHELTSPYTVDLNANVNYNTRFELVFENNPEIVGGSQGSKGSGNDPDTTITTIDELAINAYSVISTNEGFTLKNQDGLAGTINVLDVTGKLVYSTQGDGASTQINIELPHLSTGMYFVELVFKNERVYTAKIWK